MDFFLKVDLIGFFRVLYVRKFRDFFVFDDLFSESGFDRVFSGVIYTKSSGFFPMIFTIKKSIFTIKKDGNSGITSETAAPWYLE